MAQKQDTGGKVGEEVAPAEAQAAPEVDPFEAAFAEASKPEGAEAAAVIPAQAEKPAGEAVEGLLPDPAKVGADGKVEADPVAAAAAANADGEKPVAKADPGLTTEQFLERFEQIIKPAPVPVVDTKAPTPPNPITPFTKEQQAKVDAYTREWGDVFEGEQLIRMQEYQALEHHITNKILGQVAPILQQLMGSTTQIVQQTHEQQLEAAIPDLREVAPKVQAWVNEQPDYLKGAMMAVVQKGSVQQVTDLVDRYRVAKGEAAPAKPAAQALQPPTASATPPGKAAAIKALAPVKSARSGVQGATASKEDYDGGFMAALAELAD